MTNPHSRAYQNALASFKDEAKGDPKHLLACQVLACPACLELKKEYSICGICRNEVFPHGDTAYQDEASGERIGPRCWLIACKQDETTAQELLHKHDLPPAA